MLCQINLKKYNDLRSTLYSLDKFSREDLKEVYPYKLSWIITDLLYNIENLSKLDILHSIDILYRNNFIIEDEEQFHPIDIGIISLTNNKIELIHTKGTIII